MHWALAVVNFQRKRIQYFDSLGGSPNKWLDVSLTVPACLAHLPPSFAGTHQMLVKSSSDPVVRPDQLCRTSKSGSKRSPSTRRSSRWTGA
eukprot:SAG25_NODE_12914_length_273_cov_2.293103_1_plen_90_part_11